MKKIYYVSIQEDEKLGLDCVSLVDNPAVEVNFLKFNNEKLYFAKEDERIITGIALLADTEIYRFNKETNEEFYVVFPKEVVKELVERYFKNNKVNLVNLQHETKPNTDDAVMIESYFINSERGIIPEEFKDCKDGSWVVSYKIKNDDLWNEIKTSGKFNGFSVEVQSYLNDYKFYKNTETDIEELDDIESFVNEILNA